MGLFGYDFMEVGKMLPQDPIMLLSAINTYLRDEYGSLNELCRALDLGQEELTEKFKKIGYHYDEKLNQFK